MRPGVTGTGGVLIALAASLHVATEINRARVSAAATTPTRIGQGITMPQDRSPDPPVIGHGPFHDTIVDQAHRVAAMRGDAVTR